MCYKDTVFFSKWKYIIIVSREFKHILSKTRLWYNKNFVTSWLEILMKRNEYETL